MIRILSKLIWSLLFSCMASGVLHAEVAHNLFKNSGFESGQQNWDAYTNTVRISTDAYLGSKSLQFVTGGTGQVTGLLPNIELLDGTLPYVIEGYYKHSGTVHGTWAGIIYFDRNWETIAEESLTLAEVHQYTKFSLEFNPPKGTNYIGYWIWSDSDSAKTYLDEVKVYPKSFAPKGCNMLQNGDFETNLDGWSIYSSNTQHLDSGYESSHAIALLEGGMDQSIAIFDDGIDTYQLSGYYKTDGTPSGTWVGMNFYDDANQLVLSKSIGLEASPTYQKFVVNATATEGAKSVQVWVWSEGGINEGSIVLDKISLDRSTCFDYVVPSSLPPKGISVDQVPQFVVLGFDDNTMSEGITWAVDMFHEKTNSDGSAVRASFYMNTKGLDTYIQDTPSTLLASMKELKNAGHEIGNHTYDHHEGLSQNAVRNLTQEGWMSAISNGETRLLDTAYVGLESSALAGFRSPYLRYNQHTLEVLKSRNYLYDCSIEEGYASSYDGTNFRWPYQLNEGSPAHTESWYGNPENEASVQIDPVMGLWEMPVYVLMVPKNSECAAYGIASGLWSRMKEKMPYLSDYKITGFDYNLWLLAELNKEEVLGILKYNLDLRLKGNRAPLTFGAHTQYYTDSWSTNAPNATTAQMREAIAEFVEYARSLPHVRIRTASDVIKWCENPTPITSN